MASAATEFPDLDSGEGASDDPLAALGIDTAAEIERAYDDAEKAVEMQEGINRIAEFLNGTGGEGEPLYLDLETIPDMSRIDAFGLPPLPTMPPVDGPDCLMEPEQFISQTESEIRAWLGRHNPPQDWIDGCLEAERAGKNRKGTTAAFTDHVKRIVEIAGAESKRVKMMSTSPMMCRIVSAAWAVGSEKPRSFYCGDNDALESHLLQLIWRLLSRQKLLVGFGVSGFDSMVLLTRSMIRRVHPTIPLDRRRFGSSNVLDLCTELYGGGWGDALGLKPTCRSLGIEPLSDAAASGVWEMFQAGQKSEICAYNESDVDLLQRLHREFMAGYFCV